MIVTDESDSPQRLGNAYIAVRVDPHDGACQHVHDVLVLAFRTPGDEGDAATRKPPHVTLSWGTSVLLSITGSEEFAEGLQVALGIARQIRADGEYRPA